MRPASLTVVLASLAIALPGASSGQNTTVGELHEACASPEPSQQSFCAGYIVGIVEGMQSAASVVLMQSGYDDLGEIESLGMTMFGVCLPSGADKNQYIDLIVDRMREKNTSERDEARAFVHRVMVGSFPCHK